MKYKNFSISNNLLENLIKISSSTARINQIQLTTTQEKNLKSKILNINLFHLAHSLNLDLTLKDAEKYAQGKNFEHTSSEEIILSNFRNVLDFIKTTLNDQYIDIDISIMLHFNKLLLQNWKESWDVKFRSSDSNNDQTIWNDWYSLLDQSVEVYKLQDEVKETFEWYKYNSTKINDLMRAGLLLFNLVKLQPFHLANKITLIATIDFILRKDELIPIDYFPTIRIFDLNNAEYVNSWQTITAEDTDLTIWLEIFTESISKELDGIEREIIKIIEESEKSNSGVFLDLNKRQLKILKYLQTIPTVRREDYVQMMDVSTMTAFRDLNGLVEKKLLKVDGKGRATKYRLSHRN